MNDTDIRIVLDRATRHLDPYPDLLDRVHAGGRRRVRRRRAALGAGLVVALVAATGALVARPPAPDGQTGRPSAAGAAELTALMQRPTAGDLAPDEPFLSQAVDLWSTLQTNHLRKGQSLTDRFSSPPKVVWAGATPAGRAAFVAQWQRDQIGGPGIRVGFLEPGPDGTPRLDSDTVLSATWMKDRPPAMLVGARRDTLVVLDTGGPIELSKKYTLGSDGRVRRHFERLPFADGAAVVSVPPQADEFTIALALPGGAAPPGDPISVDNVGGLARPDDSQPSEPLTRKLAGGVDDAETGDPGVRWTLSPGEAFGDPPARHSAAAAPSWEITAGTPDGRLLAVQTIQYGHGPRRIVYGLGAPGSALAPVYGGATEAGGPLDVRLRLPDGQGVLIAAQGATLRYRAGTGEWQPVTGDAALLPASTTAVKVTRAGASPVTVAVP